MFPTYLFSNHTLIHSFHASSQIYLFLKQGIEWDKGAHQIMFKFEGGLRCWNGPQRSVKVHIRCGAETNVISAEEPETCAYVMTMESYIACDQIFAQEHGLKVPSAA